jgi:hypothetical protein
MNEASLERYYSPSEAARIRQLLDTGTLTCIRTPMGRLIDPDSVQTLIAARESSPRDYARLISARR